MLTISNREPIFSSFRNCKMNICWQCATKLTLPIRRRSRLLPALLHAQRRHASSQPNLNEIIRGLSIPPPEFGNIRKRLSEWQKQSGDGIVDTSAAEAETRKLNTFAATQEQEQEEAGGLVFGDDVGEMVASQIRQYVAPGSLVEIT